MCVVLRQEDASVNGSAQAIAVYNSQTKAPVPKFPNCQVVMHPGYADFCFGQVAKLTACQNRGDRKAITTFSPRSRNNLLKKLFAIAVPPSLFITLTYPKFFPADSSEWKRHLDNFRRILTERFPSAWFFWKLEPQKRGAPHYHLLGSLGESLNINVLREYVARLWFEVCGTEDIKHLYAGTSAEVLQDSRRKMQANVCKYVGKADTTEYDGWAHPGRFWGVIGRKNLPPGFSIAITLPKNDYLKLRRVIRRWVKSNSSRKSNFAKRLGSMFSFFVLIPRETANRFLDLVMEPVPF